MLWAALVVCVCVQAARGAIAAAAAKQRAHVTAAHPYRRFPIERLEEAAGQS